MRQHVASILAWLCLFFATVPVALVACDSRTEPDQTDVANARAAVAANCDCAGAASHGAYVRCAAQQANATLVNKSCAGAVKKCAAKSTCGRLDAVTCCVTKTGGTKCRIKRDPAHCTASNGSTACMGTYTSCCDACTSSGCATTTGSTTTTTLVGGGGPVTGLHYVPNNNFDSSGNYAPGTVGFNLADVSSVSELTSLSSGVKGLVWIGLCDGANSQFINAVQPFAGKAFGFYLMDEPDPTGQSAPLCTAINLMAESDWIHANVPGAKTFIVLMNFNTSTSPTYANTYNPGNSHIDLYGLDPYPCRTEVGGCDYSMIPSAVAVAEAAGIPVGSIVPVYQAFGGGKWVDDGGGKYTLPTSSQEQQILSTWAPLVSNPVFDYAYSWGTQNSDEALEGSTALQAVFSAHNVTPAVPSNIRTVFLIMMENADWSTIKGSSSAPYINRTLLPIASHAEQYYNPPNNHPSLPNYLWLEAGTNFGILNDNLPSQNQQSTTSQLVDLLEAAGISWKTYQEDEGSGAYDGTDCPIGIEGNYYDVNHNPFVYFDDVTNNNSSTATRCIQHVRPYSELLTDLVNNTVPRYNFIVPDLCHDMHENISCSQSNRVLYGDTWLSTEVPKLLASRAYANNGALFILWDEGVIGDGPIGMIVVSPRAKGGGYQNTIHYTHSSTLRTVEEIFGVTPLLGDAANATDLSDLFVSFP